jgi:hypothetical protein
MNKKVLTIIAVIVIAVALLMGYNQFFAPETSVGSKTVTVEIFVEKESIETSYEFRTDAEYLQQLLEEHTDQLKVVLEDSSYGPMLMGLEGYVSAMAENEFYAIFVNDEMGEFGIADQPVMDGDLFRFELSTW